VTAAVSFLHTLPAVSGTGTSFTVRTTEERAKRWRAAARHFGYASVTAWLYALAQEKVKEAGEELPEKVLVWKKASFTVELHGSAPEQQGLRKVSGLAAGPFGIYRGSALSYGEPWVRCYTLAHIPSSLAYVTLNRLRDCKELARQLYRLRVRWHEADPKKVTGPDEGEAGRVVTWFQAKDEDPSHH
jgi:hypothetical protein